MVRPQAKGSDAASETLIVLIRRGEQNIIPDGETIILQNDVLVLSAITPDEVHGIRLVEK